MKLGDVVMFVDNGVYAEWFFGQLGIIVAGPSKSSDGKTHCRVQWLNPVPYNGKKATVSDFSTDKLQTYKYAGQYETQTFTK